MPRCPNCNALISNLLTYSEVVNSFELDKNNEPFCYGNEQIEGYTGFECPKCNERIFDTESEAVEFLKDNDELQEMMKEKLEQIKERKKIANG
jgi:DNA-directed RNA polymerase subunit RPC12/RpoP